MVEEFEARRRERALRLNQDRMRDLIGELADLASYRDLGATALIVRDMCGILGIAPGTIPGYDEIASLANSR